MVRALSGATRVVAVIATGLLLAGGPPLLWIWIGSQVQGGPDPSGTAMVTVIAGLVISYMLIGLAVAWIAGRSGASAGPAGSRMRYAWNRSMRDEEHKPTGTHWLEDAFVAAALLVTIVIIVWFFLYGNPGVPVGM
jgi:hypothetical protein